MEQYGLFAYFYDELMDDVDYKLWADHIEGILKYYKKDVAHVLELACGTGNVTLEMFDRGYDIVGLDISEEMIEVAYNKSSKLRKKIRYICQDMVELEYEKKTDCVLCMCDGFNYITDDEDLKSCFERVYETLEDGGIFVFDISSYHKLKNILGNNFMVDKRDKINSMWINTYDDETRMIEMDLSFFVSLDEMVEKDEYDKIKEIIGDDDTPLYTKFDEVHYQRAYTQDEVVDMLREVGFKEVEAFGDFTMDSPTDTCERIFFSAVK